MKIGFLSTYPPQRCGIATYTSELVLAISELNPHILVFSESVPETGQSTDPQCVRVFHRKRDWGAEVLKAVAANPVDVIHVQHAPDIFGMDNRLIRLLQELKVRGIATVVTLHTVHTTVSAAIEGHFRISAYHRRLADAAGALVVHGISTMADTLLAQGVSEKKIAVIPHGTKIMTIPPVSDSRGKLGIPLDGALFLYFGFIRVQKNIHTVIRAFAKLRSRLPDARMLIVGSVQGSAWYNRLYLGFCRWLIRRHRIQAYCVLQERYVDREEIPVLYGAADVVLLPYAQRYGSASGVVHNALGAGRLVLCSTSPKFAEIKDGVSPSLLVDTFDAAAWGRRLVDLVNDTTGGLALRTKLSQLAELTSWSNVAALHMALYRRLCESIGT